MSMFNPNTYTFNPQIRPAAAAAQPSAKSGEKRPHASSEDTDSETEAVDPKRLKSEHPKKFISIAEFKEKLNQALKQSRGRGNAQSNCGHLTNRCLDLLRSLLKTADTTPELCTPVTSKPGGAHTMPTVDTVPIKTEGVEPAVKLNQIRIISSLPTSPHSSSVLFAAAPCLQRTIFEMEILEDGTTIEKTSKTTIIIDETQPLKPAHVANLSKVLRAQAGTDALIGVVVFTRNQLVEASAAAPHRLQMGHVLAFYADDKNVFFMDGQHFDGRKKEGEPLFTNLTSKYTFANRSDRTDPELYYFSEDVHFIVTDYFLKKNTCLVEHKSPSAAAAGPLFVASASNNNYMPASSAAAAATVSASAAASSAANAPDTLPSLEVPASAAAAAASSAQPEKINSPKAADNTPRSELQEALTKRRYKHAVELINAGAQTTDLKKADGGLFRWAVVKGHVEIVQALINKGQNVDMIGKPGITPLMYAVKYAQKEVIQVLLHHGADILETSSLDSAETPLGLAIKLGHKDIITQLLQKAAQTSKKICKFNGPISIAIENGHHDIIQEIYTATGYQRAVDSEQKLSVVIAAHKKNQKEVLSIIASGVETKDIRIIDEYSFGTANSFLIYSFNFGMYELATHLIQKKENLDLTQNIGHTLLMIISASPWPEEVGRIAHVLIENGANVKLKDADGKSALVHALSCLGNVMDFQKVQLIEKLVNNGADFKGIKIRKRSLLGWAILNTNGHPATKNLALTLIARGADVNAVEIDGHTALTTACMNGHIDIVDALLEKGANVNYVAPQSLIQAYSTSWMIAPSRIDTPLSLAIANKFINIAIKLIHKGAYFKDILVTGLSLLRWSVVNAHKELELAILVKTADVNAIRPGGHNPLMDACISGHVDAVDALIRSGANVNYTTADHKTPLSVACTNGFINVAIKLIHAGADFTNIRVKNLSLRNWSMMHKGHTELALALIAKTADVNTVSANGGYTLLQYACFYGHQEIVKVLLERGADVNYISCDKHTPLSLCFKNNQHPSVDIAVVLINRGADFKNIKVGKLDLFFWAIYHGHNALIQALLAKNADVNLADEDGRTLLMFACALGRIEIVQLLIEKGADVNKATTNQNNSLFCALAYGYMDIADFLIQKGANSQNLTTKFGQTPLSHAAYCGRMQAVKNLLQYGCDIYARDIRGKSAYALAKEKNLSEIANIIADHTLNHFAVNILSVANLNDEKVSFVNDLLLGFNKPRQKQISHAAPQLPPEVLDTISGFEGFPRLTSALSAINTFAELISGKTENIDSREKAMAFIEKYIDQQKALKAAEPSPMEIGEMEQVD